MLELLVALEPDVVGALDWRSHLVLRWELARVVLLHLLLARLQSKLLGDVVLLRIGQLSVGLTVGVLVPPFLSTDRSGGALSRASVPLLQSVPSGSGVYSSLSSLSGQKVLILFLLHHCSGGAR